MKVLNVMDKYKVKLKSVIVCKVIIALVSIFGLCVAFKLQDLYGFIATIPLSIFIAVIGLGFDIELNDTGIEYRRWLIKKSMSWDKIKEIGIASTSRAGTGPIYDIYITTLTKTPIQQSRTINRLVYNRNIIAFTYDKQTMLEIEKRYHKKIKYWDARYKEVVRYGK